MALALTEKEFLRYVDTKYRVNVDNTPESIELELVEVKSYANKNKPGEQKGYERFSLLFDGPAEVFLRQQIYQVSHSEMGDLELFLVPIGRHERGFRYEAVFNVKSASNA